MMLFVMSAFNLYFVFIMKTGQITYLLYLDMLLLVLSAGVEGTAFFRFLKSELYKQRLFQEKFLLYEMGGISKDEEIFEHDLQLLETRVQEKFVENCELQDFVAKWCHEFKIPMSAALLMAGKIRDTAMRTELKTQLERMNWQLNMMLQGCRLQGPLFDMQIKQFPLRKCISASIKNNQFFLIQNKFQLDVRADDIIVYTDEGWLTYMLDQILSNAVKYAKPDNDITLRRIAFWTECDSNPYETDIVSIKLFIEDNGEGIKECDIRRIFEKGYTGSNYHNGRYKSTGMGLYMAENIAKRLGHQLTVESSYGEYTRFCITFFGKAAEKNSL